MLLFLFFVFSFSEDFAGFQSRARVILSFTRFTTLLFIFFSFQWFHLLTSWYNKIYVSKRCAVLLAKLRFPYMLFIFSNCLNHSKSYKLRAFIKEKKHHG